VRPTQWSFGQLGSLVGAPAAYLRQLPAALAGLNLRDGLSSHRAERVKTFETADSRTELRTVTGPDYGRIHDFVGEKVQLTYAMKAAKRSHLSPPSEALGGQRSPLSPRLAID
jgi:hypothetical protein